MDVSQYIRNSSLRTCKKYLGTEFIQGIKQIPKTRLKLCNTLDGVAFDVFIAQSPGGCIHPAVFLFYFCNYWTDLDEIWYWESAPKGVKQVYFNLYWTNAIATLLEAQVKYHQFSDIGYCTEN